MIFALEVLVALAAVIHAIEYGTKFYGWLKKRSTSIVPSVRPHDITLGILWSLVCALIWSLSYVSLSYVSAKVDPFDVNVIMFGTAACFLFASYLIVRLYAKFSLKAERPPTEPGVDWKTMTPWITTLANVGNFVFFIYALYFISASQAITLGQTYPVFVALLTWLWLRVPLPRSAMAATALAVFGALLIVVEQDFVIMNSTKTFGSIIAVCGGAAFAVFSTGLEKIEHSRPALTDRLSFMGTAFTVAYLGVLSVAYLKHRVPAVIDPASLVILALNGLRVAVVYLLYGIAVRYIGALLVSILLALTVPFTMLWDSRLLHRQPLPKLIIGAAAIVIAALTLASDRFRAMRAAGAGNQTLEPSK